MVVPGRRLRDTKLLPDLNEVGVLQAILIGLEDLRVERRVAVELLGDLRECVALLHFVPLRGVPRVGGFRGGLGWVGHTGLQVRYNELSWSAKPPDSVQARCQPAATSWAGPRAISPMKTRRNYVVARPKAPMGRAAGVAPATGRGEVR